MRPIGKDWRGIAMLVTCPHCNKKIGEGQSECPMCKENFSKLDIENMRHERSEIIRNQQKAEYDMLQKFRKKRKRFLIALGISFAITLAAFPLLFKLALTEYSFLAYIGLLAMPIVIIVGIITGGARCPYCGMILMRQHGPHCARCGGRIH